MRLFSKLAPEKDIALRTCSECGTLLDRVDEFHPYAFCVLRKAGQDPWDLIQMWERHQGRAKA